MGILNVTPDSFTDGGRYDDVGRAVERALRLIDEGADIIDVGGESTRPGAAPVEEDIERARVLPVITALRARTDLPISIDTMKPAIARDAVAAGARMWNDVSALGFAADSLATAACLACPVILMHRQPSDGETGVIEAVSDFLAARAAAAIAAGVAREAIWLDPGIGFRKTPAQSLAILRDLDRIVERGFPVLLGASRKRFIAAVDASAAEPADRLAGSIAVGLAGARAGVAALRVHDVRETRQALLVDAAIHG